MRFHAYLPLSLGLIWALGLTALAQVPTPEPTPLPAPMTQPATPSATEHNLADLKQHPNLWPPLLFLTDSVRLTITRDGVISGAIVSPEGAAVALIGVNDTTIEIGVGSARAIIAPEKTDLWTRVAALAALPTPTPTPTPTPATFATAASGTTGSTNSEDYVIPPLVPQAITPPPTPPPLSSPRVVSDTPVVTDYQAAPRGNFTKAIFRFWTPAYAQPIRGIIVLSPVTTTGDGRDAVKDPLWEALALKYRLALVGCYFQGAGSDGASLGSGGALLEALKDFARQTQHAEIGTVPLLFYGEDIGGQFDYNFALWRPDRVMGFVVNKGGVYDSGAPTLQMCAVPGLFILGMTDTALRGKNITQLWATGRKFGALWALAPQPKSGHDFTDTPALARTYFDAVLKGRLPDDAAADADAPPLKTLAEGNGWLGDLATFTIRAAASSPDTEHKNAWLPDNASATAWKIFVSSAGVAPDPNTRPDPNARPSSNLRPTPSVAPDPNLRPIRPD